MNDKEILSPKALRKLDNIIIHHENLLKNKELQQELVAWAQDMLAEARKDWEAMRTISIDTIIFCDRKKEAKRKASLKDEKYAPSFKKITTKDALENAVVKMSLQESGCL